MAVDLEKLVPSGMPQSGLVSPPELSECLEMLMESLFTNPKDIYLLTLSLKQSPDLEISHQMYVIRSLGEAYGLNS